MCSYRDLKTVGHGSKITKSRNMECVMCSYTSGNKNVLGGANEMYASSQIAPAGPVDSK